MYEAPVMEPTAAMTSTEELHGTRQWMALKTAKQRLWVDTFIESDGDAVLATQVAFNCPSARSARVLSYEVADNPKIRAVLDIFYGRDERTKFVDRLQKQIEDGSLSVAQERAIRLFCEMKGWAVPTLPRRKNQAAESENVVPEGARAWVNGSGVVIGYRTADGQDVRL